MKKRLLSLLMVMLAVLMPTKLWAQEPYAVLSEDGLTVTFYYDDQKSIRGGIDINNSNSSYGSSSPYGTATTAVIDVSFAEYKPTSTAYWFHECSSLATITGMENLNTQNVTSMHHMFYGCSSLTSLDVSNFNTSSVTDMSCMFWNCSGLTSLDVSNFKTDQVTSMWGMFSGCSGLTSLDVSTFNTANVTDISWMFAFCSGLTSLDISNFNTNNVTDMYGMFSGCSGLTNLDVSNFNTANVTSMRYMFCNCYGLTSLDISNFNTANVTDISWMFCYCSGLTSLDLSSFNTAKVTNMEHMFSSDIALTTIYAGSGWDKLEVNTGGYMFEGCTKLVGGAGTEFDANHTDDTYAHIDGGPDNPGYFTDIADTTAVAEVTFTQEMNELTLQCATPNTTIWYSINSGSSDVQQVSVAEFNAAEVSTDVWYQLTGTVNNLKDGDSYGNFDLEDATGSVYVYGLLAEKGGEKKAFQVLAAEKGIVNGSTITIIGNRGEYGGKIEVTNAYYVDNAGDSDQWQQYTAPLNLSENCTVKAYAARPSGIRSAVSSYDFTVSELPKVETPSFAWEDEKLTISSATEGATIYYSAKECVTEPTGDGTQTSPYNVAAALQYIQSLGADVQSPDSIYVRGIVMKIYDISPQFGNATFYLTDDGKASGKMLCAYRIRDIGNQKFTKENAFVVGDEVIIRGLVVNYKGNTPETVSNSAYIYAYTTPEMNTLYESPLSLSGNNIVRAKATKPGMSDSDMAVMTVGGEEPYAVLVMNNSVAEGDSTAPAPRRADTAMTYTLKFYYDNKKSERGGMSVGPFVQSYDTTTETYYVQGREWEEHVGEITTVEFDQSFSNCNTITNMVGWFFANSQLQTIKGLEYLNTGNVTNMLGLFNGCTSLTSLDLSSFDTHSVTDMRGMFYGCTSLASVNVSSFNTSKVRYFNSMFNNCNSLRSIDVTRFDTKNVSSMRMMFRNCRPLESLDISNFETANVKDMYSMFAGCSNVKTIYVGEHWSTESVVVTDSTTYGSYVFSNCTSLVGGMGTAYDSLHVDKTYAHIDGGIDNPGYFTNIADTAAVVDEIIQFADANVKAICVKNWDTNGDGELSKTEAAAVTSLNQVFYRNGDITSFDEFQYFTGVKEIGEREFMDCSKLSSIILPSTLESINREAFYYCGLSEITIPASVTSIHYAGLYQCFRNIYVDSDNPNYCSVDGVLYSKDLTKILCYPVRRNEESYTILSSVTVIGGCSFYGCYLKRIEIPSGVTRFEQGAFRYCHNLVSVDIPEGIEIIEDENYQYCDSLQSVSVPASVTSIASDVFNGCPMLQEINVDPNNQEYASVNGIFYNKTLSKLIVFPPAKPETSFEIPEGVTEIGTYAFYGCKNLTAISIPQTVNTIGYASFTHETNLMSVTVFKKQPIRISDCFTDETFQNGTLYVPSGTKALYEAANGWKRFLNIVEMEPAVDYAFDTTTGVLTISGGTSLADALSAAGGRDEVAKTITAILWENDMPLTNSDLQGLDNPNMLIYVKSDSLAPVNRDNVVVNGFAKNIVLTDVESGNNNFYCPGAFKAEMISYTRNFQQQTEIGVSRGWETIALPFDVQTIMHEKNGVISPFGNAASTKHFWLRQLTYDGIAQATAIEANTPYIISMPNSNDYPAEFNQAGRVTFSSQNAVVPVTSGNVASVRDSATNTMIVFYPTMQRIAQNEELYALNVGDPHTGYAEGSVFVAGLRDIRPFECYTWHHAHGPAPQFIPINELNGGATGIETIDHSPLTIHQWYDLNGRRLQQKPTRKGVYILNGRAVVIK